MEKPSNKVLNSGSNRISELPESLLLHILSFLSTKRAVQTSILSKRWHYVWTSLQKLELDQREFYSDHDTSSAIQQPSSTTTRFSSFVDRVLSLRAHSSLERFQLWWYGDFDMDRMSTWIDYAMRHNVRDLILDISPDEEYELPSSIFRCQSLVKWKLATPNKVLRLPDSVGFSKVRTLDLDGVAILGDVGQLISNCPVLVDLQVMVLLSSDLNISAPQLVHLILGCIGNTTESVKVQISAPRLLTFGYTSAGLVECSLVHIPNLIAASISFVKDRDENSTNLSHILRRLCDVRVLRLGEFTIKALSRIPDVEKCILPFHKLGSLGLRSKETFLNEENIQVITILLGMCPNMNNFVMKIFKEGKCQLDLIGLEDDWKPQKLHNECDLYHLNTIEIYGFDGGKDGLKFINFLLEKATALQKLDLVYEKGSPHFDMHMKLKSTILLDVSTCTKVADYNGLEMLTSGRVEPFPELFARIDAVDAVKIKETLKDLVIDKDVAVAAMGPLQQLPDHSWFRSQIRAEQRQTL